MDGKVTTGWTWSFFSVSPNFGNTTQIATQKVTELGVLCQGSDFCFPTCTFSSIIRAFNWAHGCWMKDHISQPPLDVTMWLSSGQWEMRSDVCKFWDICIKKRNTNSPSFSPSCWLEHWCDGGCWDNHLRSQEGSHVSIMANKTSEAAWGPDPAKPSYLWHETEKLISLWLKSLYLWVPCDGSLIYISQWGYKRNTSRSIASFFLSLGNPMSALSLALKQGKLRYFPVTSSFCVSVHHYYYCCCCCCYHYYCFKYTRGYEHEQQ